MANELTHRRLKELFYYDELTGLLTRKKTMGRFVSGSVAGFGREDGYVQVKIDSVNYLAHRLAWFYVKGEMPIGEIDHINHIRYDNMISNLRDVSRLENSKNCSTKKSGNCANGVYFDKRSSKYVARIYDNGKVVSLGYFKDLFDAACARKSAENKFGYHENHGQRKGN